MILMKDPRKMAALILAVKKPDEAGGQIDDQGPSPQDAGAEQDYQVGLSSSAKDLIAAVKAESEEGVVSALKDFVDLCMQADAATPETPGEY